MLIKISDDVSVDPTKVCLLEATTLVNTPACRLVFGSGDYWIVIEETLKHVEEKINAALSLDPKHRWDIPKVTTTSQDKPLEGTEDYDQTATETPGKSHRHMTTAQAQDVLDAALFRKDELPAKEPTKDNTSGLPKTFRTRATSASATREQQGAQDD